MNDVQDLIGLHRSTVYRMIDRKEFPAPIRLSPNAVGWLREEVDEWVATRRRTA